LGVVLGGLPYGSNGKHRLDSTQIRRSFVI